MFLRARMNTRRGEGGEERIKEEEKGDDRFLSVCCPLFGGGIIYLLWR